VGLLVKIETGKWKLESGKWKLGMRNWDCQFPVSIFHFPVSSFQLLAWAERHRLFDHLPPELLYWRKTSLKFESK
jgi:hypothetical protein